MVTFPAPDSAKVEPSRPDLSPRANICFPGPVAVGNLPAMLPPIQSCENRSAVNLRGLSINRKGPLTAGTLLVAGAGWLLRGLDLDRPATQPGKRLVQTADAPC